MNRITSTGFAAVVLAALALGGAAMAQQGHSGHGAPAATTRDSAATAAFKAANEVYAEISAKNPDFKAGLESLRAFRGEEYLWFQVAEYTYDSFMIRNRTKG